MSVSSLSPDQMPPFTLIESADPAKGSEEQPANRSFLITWILSMLLGFLGADRFYTGRVLTGGLKLVTLGGLGLWWVIDLVIVMAGGLRYCDRPLSGYDSSKEIAWIATGFLLIIGYSLRLDQDITALLTQLF